MLALSNTGCVCVCVFSGGELGRRRKEKIKEYYRKNLNRLRGISAECRLTLYIGKR